MALLKPMWLPNDGTGVPFGPAAGKQGLRYMLQQIGLQEGVYDAADLKISQRGAGANMSVDVAAGSAWIQGDDTARQGVYHLVNDATVNVAVSAAHATLPRIDQVIARIYDSSVAGGSDTPAIEVLAGTATAGATLANRTGAAALPNGAVRLADVLVAAAASSIANAAIQDRRPWARGGFRAIEKGDADFSTTNGTNTAVTGLVVSMECSGAPVRITFSAMGRNSLGATAEIWCGLKLDGNDLGSNVYQLGGLVGDRYGQVGFVTVLSVAAGRHTFQPGIRIAGGTGGTAVLNANSISPARLIVEELVRPNTDNT